MCSILACSCNPVSGSRAFRGPGSWGEREEAALQSQAEPPPSDRDVGQGGSQQECLRTPGALDSRGVGVGRGGSSSW